MKAVLLIGIQVAIEDEMMKNKRKGRKERNKNFGMMIIIFSFRKGEENGCSLIDFLQNVLDFF